MRIIIVVTAPPPEYQLWALSQEWELDPNCGQTAVRVAIVGPDRVLVLCQAESKKRHEMEAILDSRAVTTPWVHQVANLRPYSNGEKIYVAAHAKYVDLRKVELQIQGKRYAAGAFFSHETHRPNSKLFEDLVELFEKRDHDAFETAIESIEHDQELTQKQRLATLKHRLAHVFLPVIFDLHAWREVDFDDDFMNEILKSYAGSEGRLDRARYFIYEQAESSDVDSVERLVKESELENDADWRMVQALLPRQEPEFDQGKDLMPFSVLESLKDKERLIALRTRLQQDDNPFVEWTKTLEAALSELANKID